MGPMSSNLTRGTFVLQNGQISMFRGLLLRNSPLCQQAVITLMLSIHTLMSVPSFIRIERGLDKSPCLQT